MLPRFDRLTLSTNVKAGNVRGGQSGNQPQDPEPDDSRSFELRWAPPWNALVGHVWVPGPIEEMPSLSAMRAAWESKVPVLNGVGYGEALLLETQTFWLTIDNGYPIDVGAPILTNWPAGDSNHVPATRLTYTVAGLDDHDRDLLKNWVREFVFPERDEEDGHYYSFEMRSEVAEVKLRELFGLPTYPFYSDGSFELGYIPFASRLDMPIEGGRRQHWFFPRRMRLVDYNARRERPPGAMSAQMLADWGDEDVLYDDE